MQVVDGGLVYRNPKPHLCSVHAWHPSLARRDDGVILAAFDLGEAVESLDYGTWLSRSADGGKTWEPPRPLFRDTVSYRSTHAVRISRMKDGTLVAFGGRFHRDNPEEGLTNRANLGYVPVDLILLKSHDGGENWEGPMTITTPLVGAAGRGQAPFSAPEDNSLTPKKVPDPLPPPSFEICHRIIELADGRWLAPTATWKGWHGEAPNGMKAIALVSHDKGQSWPEYITVADQYERGIVSWEQGVTQLADGRLLAVIWCFDEKAGKSLPNRFTLCQDGRTFGPLRENGLRGETAKVITLADGRVLCLYRRLDKPGLWANLVRIDGDNWISLQEKLLWRGPLSGMLGERNSGDELSALKFGFPSMLQLPDGDVLAMFWCLEECLHCIRWVRLAV